MAKTIIQQDKLLLKALQSRITQLQVNFFWRELAQEYDVANELRATFGDVVNEFVHGDPRAGFHNVRYAELGLFTPMRWRVVVVADNGLVTIYYKLSTVVTLPESNL